MSEASIHGSTIPVCAACGADMVCSEHGFMPCEMCEAEGLTPSLLCSRCGNTKARVVSEAERLDLLRKEINPQAAKFKTLLNSAGGGDIAAQYSVALMYWIGDGTRQNKAAAIKWFRTAAGHGHTESQLWLGRACLQGEMVRKSAPEAVKWYREAANKKNLAAQYELAMLLYEGSGSIRQDLMEAGHWMTEAANAGLADAQYQLGLHSDGKAARYWLQKAAAQGHKEASESLSKLLIDEGNDPLYDEAVKFVLESRNVSISLVQRHLRIGYNRAARLIDQMELAGIVSPLRSDGRRDVLLSLESKPAAIKKPKETPKVVLGSGTSHIPFATIVWAILIVGISAFLLGVLWIGGPFFNSEQERNSIKKHQQNVVAQELAAQEGVTQIVSDPPPVAEAPVAQDDIPQPIIWSNHSFSGSALAVENKADTRQEPPTDAAPQPEAAPKGEWFGTAFQPLPPEFIRAMGPAFGKVFGPDGPKDFGEGVKWYFLAANQGYASAQYNLGVMYHYGRGVPKDHKEAEKWYRLAADKGDAAAQYNLKMMRDNGQDVPPVSTGWIGVGIRALSSDFIHSMGLAEGQGVLITEVLNAGPAAQAGMAVGDILISVNKKTVGTGNILEVVSSLPVGNVAQFEVLRNDARMLLTVRVGQKP